MASRTASAKLDSLPTELRAIADRLIAAKFPPKPRPNSVFNGFGTGMIRGDEVLWNQITLATNPINFTRYIGL